ncbi:hypothetical protein DFH06DRAFT_579665 [Mycena polygramma]|nr:hypothetical protein DFH06DRAFT_579665 [Mycena polygramma]
MRNHLCMISALSPDAGPTYFALKDGSSDSLEKSIEDVALEMAAEIGSLGCEGDPDTDGVQQIIEESLTLTITASDDYNFGWWLEDYLGRRHGWNEAPADLKEDFFLTGVVIGPKVWESPEIVLWRVEDYNEDMGKWSTVVIEGENGEDKKVEAVTGRPDYNPYYGPCRGAPFFCWERPYRYFETWMRRASRLSSWDGDLFMRQFYRLVNDNRGIDDDDSSGLLTCVSYGGIEKTLHYRCQDLFVLARAESTNTASAIAAGVRGRDLWPALGLDFGAWMATRPDLWPSPPSAPQPIASYLEFAKRSMLHNLPAELLVQILPLLSVQDLLSVLQLSRGVYGLIQPLLDETLWHHVHRGDLGWILPVKGVKGEVERANTAARGWYSECSELASVFDSKDFPFSRFVSECSRSNSMRNRRRLWNIFKQYKALWETMDFE